jgi:hypothetical protein
MEEDVSGFAAKAYRHTRRTCPIAEPDPAYLRLIQYRRDRSGTLDLLLDSSHSAIFREDPMTFRDTGEHSDEPV